MRKGAFLGAELLNLGEPRDYLRLFFYYPLSISVCDSMRFCQLSLSRRKKSQSGSELSLLLFAKVERERERETVRAYDSFPSIYTSYFREETLF